ncbi:septum site-determining protein MinC [Lyngbya sp. PCC 8106]|uniref:septum site-determining protein MinC n=1 Tax=Lyngbya sp. (strain PCC 8106) TaxID=313612 RepID=UPI0000EAB752|nr:septum site-determining protein MinC [Lyngbya sp. PCC 8106]EAW36564.1 septum formation inhibitor [Lyngbya sp. PCC 8106]
MQSDTSSSTTVTPENTVQPKDQATPPSVNLQQQVRFKSLDGRLLLILPPETPNLEDSDPPTGSQWTELWQQLKHRINGSEHAWKPDTEVHLIAGNRLLDVRQLQEIAEALTIAQLHLKRVQTSRRQTAVAAATVGYSVDQDSERNKLNNTSIDKADSQADPLYLQTTLRSGMEVKHPGTVIIVGDVNPGSTVVAEGDIIIWGRLRGSVHAGVNGNLKSMIMALQMEPTLIRIADQMARGPEKPPAQFYPEIAYMTSQGVRISKASDYAKVKLWQVRGDRAKD